MSAAAVGLPILFCLASIAVWVATIVKTVQYNKLAEGDPKKTEMASTVKDLQKTSKALAGSIGGTILIVLFFVAGAR